MKILLFSDIPPCTNVTAGIVLNKLCDCLLDEGHELCCYSIYDHSLAPRIPSDKQTRIPLRTERKPREGWGSKFGSFVCNNAVAALKLPRMADRVAAFAKEQKVDLIWSVMQGQTMIKMTRAVSRKSKIPYVAQTWDPTEWWLKANKFDSFTHKSVMKEYGRVLHNAECFIAASWAMEKEYGEKYHCKRAQSVVLGFPEEIVSPPRERNPEEFVIAMSGQIYAAEEFAQLVQALDRLNWECHGRKIILRLYGVSFTLTFPHSANVEIKGWVDQKKLLPELACADLLYCPYWFSQEYAVVSRLSFPSKLSTYLKAGRPVMFHGPKYASPNKFLEKHNAGYRCNTNDPEKIAELIEQIMLDPQQDKVIHNQIKAFHTSLTEDCMKRDFFKALDLPVRLNSVTDKHPLINPVHEADTRVVHINHVDVLGNRWNGYEMMLTVNRFDGWMRQLVMEKMSSCPEVATIVDPVLRGVIDPIICQYETENNIHALAQPYGRKIAKHPFFTDADVAHFHLTHNNVLSWTDMPALTKAKPSVLTIHDPWLLTGHCVHPIECQRWLTGCGDCPHLDRHFPMKKDNTAQMFAVRKRLLEQCDMDFIVSSQWMMRLAKASPMLQGKRIHLIPFGLDLNLFAPAADPAALRRKHGINDDEFVLMFRQDTGEFKGMKYIIEALKALPADRKVTLLTVGATGFLKELEKRFRIIELPWITSNTTMVELYACCDLFLMPSIAESFGMMAVEAMACARPVLVFEGTALPDVTFAPDCGILVPSKDSAAIAQEILHMMDDPQERQRRAELGRQLALEHYDYNKYVTRHLELYSEIKARHAQK